jgi:hypothetical protein
VSVYPFIEAEKASSRNVKRACELLKVSRAAFYQYLSGPSRRERADAELAARIREVHQGSKGRYGSPRVHAQLAAMAAITAASGSPGSCARPACTAGRRNGGKEPPSPTPGPRPARTGSAVTSPRTPPRSTAAGAATSPTSPHGKDGCTYQLRGIRARVSVRSG